MIIGLVLTNEVIKINTTKKLIVSYVSDELYELKEMNKHQLLVFLWNVKIDIAEYIKETFEVGKYKVELVKGKTKKEIIKKISE